MRRILIVGGGVAGCVAALYARKYDKEAEVVVVEKERYPAYSRCGLPYLISGKVSSPSDLLEYPLDFYSRVAKINMLLSSKVKDIDCCNNMVTLESNGHVSRLEYDSLIIATGAKPIIPKFAHEKDRVFVLRSIDDALSIKRLASKSKNAVVIGGGFVGLEVAEALHGLGLNVTLMEMKPHILPFCLDQDMALAVEQHIERHGIRLHLGKAVEEILPQTDRVEVIAGDEHVEGDFIVLCVGVVGEVKVAEEAGISLGSTKLIKVNEQMRTSKDNVYAAGDCVESWDPIYKLPMVFQLGSVAVRQAMIAGINAAGGAVKSQGFVGAATTKLFGLELAYAGFSESLAEKYGIKAVSAKVKVRDKVHYFRGDEVSVKIVVDSSTARIIGGQVVGANATKYADLISLAIMRGCKVDDLSSIETCYSPAVSPVWSPVSIASQTAMRKLGLYP